MVLETLARRDELSRHTHHFQGRPVKASLQNSMSDLLRTVRVESEEEVQEDLV